MSEQDLTWYDALHIAMEAELKAAVFYTDAEVKTTNPWGKQLFQTLIVFEQYHYQKLTDLEKSLREQGKFIQYEGKKLEFSAVSSILSSQEENPKSVVDILSLAMDIEVEAENRYKHLQKLTQDTDGKEMFMKLAKEEALHYKYINDAYWSLSKRGVWELPK